MTPEELIRDLSEFYGYEVDLSYAINYYCCPIKLK